MEHGMFVERMILWIYTLPVALANKGLWEPLSLKKVIIWVVPPPSNSHHPDYSIFSRESL